MSRIPKNDFVRIVLPGKSEEQSCPKGREEKAVPPPPPEPPQCRKMTEAEWRTHYRAVAQERAAKEAAREAADFEEAIQRAEVEIALIQAKAQPSLADQESAVWDIQLVLDDLGHEDDPRIKMLSEMVTKREAFLDELEEEASQDSLDLEPVELEPLPSLATVLKTMPTGLSSDPELERGLVQHVLDLGAGGELCAVGVIGGILIMVLSLGYTKDPALLLAFGAIFGGLLFIPGMILIVAQGVARAFRRGKPWVNSPIRRVRNG
jgi:hypothetical protein